MTELRRALDLDAVYLSRLLARFEADGHVARRRSPVDARKQLACLTDRGREVYAVLDSRSADEVAALLCRLPAEHRERLLAAMATIREVLEHPTTC